MTATIVPVESIRKPGGARRASDSDDISEQLAAFVDPSRILTRPIDRIAFASDASLYHLVPRAVVQPIYLEEIRGLFQFSREKKIPLTFRAGGTS